MAKGKNPGGSKKKNRIPGKPKTDATFGMKNKKGVKGRSMERSAKASEDAAERMRKSRADAVFSKKDLKAAKAAEMASILKEVNDPRKRSVKVKEKEEEDLSNLTLEQVIDRNISLIKARDTLTPVNKVSFEAWKEAKRGRQLEERRARALNAAKTRAILSGRDMFAADPTQFKDDDNAATGDMWTRLSAPEKPDDDTSASAAAAGAAAAAKAWEADPATGAVTGAVDASLFTDDVELPSDMEDD